MRRNYPLPRLVAILLAGALLPPLLDALVGLAAGAGWSGSVWQAAGLAVFGLPFVALGVAIILIPAEYSLRGSPSAVRIVAFPILGFAAGGYLIEAVIALVNATGGDSIGVSEWHFFPLGAITGAVTALAWALLFPASKNGALHG